MLARNRGAVVVVTCIGRLDPRIRLRWQRRDHVREHVVRQPASAVVVRLARKHPVTRSVWIASNAVGALARVIPCRQESAGRAYREIGLPLRTRRGIGVQLQRRAKGHTTVRRTDVIDVARITGGPLLGINQVNEIVDRSRLTPAFMPPVAAEIVEHTGKVADSCYARSREGCAGIGVGPRAAAVGGLEDKVGVVVRETTTAFIHTCNIYRPAARKVAGDLYVTHKGSLRAHHRRATPSRTPIGRMNGENVRIRLIKVVPGNVQSSEKR